MSDVHDPSDHLNYRGNICISGLTASGKTTHSHLLAGEFGLTYVSGSQIQLNFLGVSPIQARDFWISNEAKALWADDQFRRIDAELLHLEGRGEGYVFDTSTMPWRHQRPALCIWLQSSLESRVLKSIVSHHGQSRFDFRDYQAKLTEKDAATISLYETLYGMRIGSDLECFDLILDIGSLITEASLTASLRSIEITHRLVRPAAAWYLTGDATFERDFREALRTAPPGLVVRNRLSQLLPSEDIEP